MIEERRLAAVLHGDMVDFSRLMFADESLTIRTLKVAQQHLSELAERNAGRIVDTAGDSVLAEFRSVVDAVACGIAFQVAVVNQHEGIAAEQKVYFRIGIHIGDVVFDEGRIFGDGVNIAARVQAIAPPGGVCLSGTALELILGKLPVEFDDLGVRELKNIARPVHVYQVRAREGEIERFLERRTRKAPSVGTDPARGRATSPQNLLLAMWDLLEPNLQDAFAPGV
jgi:adenylate cyclase